MTSPLSRRSRSVLWYAKFILACYAAGFSAALLLLLISMPIFGPLLPLTERRFGVEPFGVAILLFAVAFAPIIWRRLK